MRSRQAISRRGGVSRLALCLALLAAPFAFAGCGYHVAGHASTLPAEWTDIAIPAFKNDTTTYRIEQRMTQAVIREFITRTKYRVVQDPSNADAVLHGEVSRGLRCRPPQRGECRRSAAGRRRCRGTG